LRTLLLVVTACAVTLSALQMGEVTFEVVVLLFLSAAVVGAWIEQRTPPVDRLLFFYILAVLLFLFLVSLLAE